MQAKLPDVNAALVRHRNAIMIAYDQKDFTKATISFDAIISLLPDDYKLDINTPKYEELVKDKHNIICDKCKIEHKRNEIFPYKILLTNLDRLISRQKTVRIWRCPGCGFTRPLEGSQTKTIKYSQPTYFGVIPDPPKREGLHDRIGFTEKFKAWYDIAFREIEQKIGLYRTEYAAQQNSVMEVIPDE